MQLDAKSEKRSEKAASPSEEAEGGKKLDADAHDEAEGHAHAREADAASEGHHAAAGEQTPYALMGYFTSSKDIFHACEALRDAGYSRFDAHTPFPVHGLEKAMGLKPSPLPWIVLAGGFTGFVSGIALAWYTQTVAYPLDISGKPPSAYQAYVPVIFELTILCAALSCFVGLFVLGRMPQFFHPTMTHPSFPRSTDDAFFVSIEASDPKFDTKETRSLLQRLGAQGIAEVFS